MNVFEFFILLVVIVLVYQLWELKIRNKRAAAEHTERDNLEARLRDVETRIQVLERIVTDSKYELHRQFSELEGGPGDAT